MVPSNGVKVRKCCVPSCNEVKNQANHFHTVPARRDRLEVWKRALGRHLTKNMRVCSSHFCKEDYVPTVGAAQRPNLKRTAVPHVFPFPEETPAQVNASSDDEARREILKELESYTPDMVITVEESHALEKDAMDILDTIELEAGFSSQLFPKIQELRKYAGCLGPFGLFPHLQSSLFNFMEEYYGNVCGTSVNQGGLLTEVLILAVMKVKQFERKDAYTYVEQASLKQSIH